MAVSICASVEQGSGGEDLAALAVAALGDVEVDPGLLEEVELAVGGEAFDGGDVAVGFGNGELAGADGLAVDVDGAGAAFADAAAVLGALEVELVAQDPEERGVVGDVDGEGVAVDVEGVRHGRFTSCGWSGDSGGDGDEDS
jgi:hypothetical protein